jgi:sigma-B regulation protein RsbU (phosphoserine phosphatase)
MIVPLRVGGRVVGVIEVFSRRPREFRSPEVRLLETFADRVALAVDNAKAFEQQQEIAAIIQQALLPPGSVRLPGLVTVGRYQPSREVGGDFYAIFPLSETRIGLAIADVSGKGIPAATLSARARYLLEAIALDSHRPDSVLERLNRVLSAGAESGMFVSLFYGVLDSVGGTFAFANAGHLPPVLLRARAARVDVLEAPGLLLGVDPSTRYAHSEVRVGPDDLLVLFTDGITEARDARGEQFGDRRIAALIETWGGEPPARLADRVMDAVRGWSGTDPTDDQALLIACVAPQVPPETDEGAGTEGARDSSEVRAVR